MGAVGGCRCSRAGRRGLVGVVTVTVTEVDLAPVRLAARDRRPCQGWRCALIAIWNRWGGYYCTDHAIRAGWLPGPVRHPGAQLVIS